MDTTMIKPSATAIQRLYFFSFQNRRRMRRREKSSILQKLNRQSRQPAYGKKNGWIQLKTVKTGVRAFEGVHFHWYMEGVDREAIEEISDSGGEEGTTPSAGNTQEAPPEEAYDKSGCHQDMEETYHRFIALRYSYAFQSFRPETGISAMTCIQTLFPSRYYNRFF